MDQNALDKLLLTSESLKEWAGQFAYRRYLYEAMAKTGKDFYVGIRGIRGIGKTVLLLQVAKETKNSAYFSADASYLTPYSVYEIADSLRKKGITTIFMDEIHTRPGWEKDIKTLYDEHEISVFFSGSSSLGIKKAGADLSRRAVVHELKPASFREYLNIRKGAGIGPYSLESVLSNAKKLSLSHMRIAEHMDEYMRYGGVLYSGDGFNDALKNSLEKAVSVDLAAMRDINIKYESDAYRLLYHVAASKPFEVSFSSLAQKLGVSKSFAIRLVNDLASAGLLLAVFPCRGKNQDVVKEPKIFLPIPLRMFLVPGPEKGSLREEFFVNHVPVSCYLKTARGEKTADFMVDGKTIEVGGVSKSFVQKPDYIAVDSALGEEKKVPLFLFGLTY